MAFAIKAEIRDRQAPAFSFTAHKTMYGGKHVAAGDTVFVFASEGPGLFARGTVTFAEALPRAPGIERQTPRVTLAIRRDALATRPLGRTELKHLTAWKDGQPGTELNFKFYRQTTNKLVSVSDATAAFLETFF